MSLRVSSADGLDSSIPLPIVESAQPEPGKSWKKELHSEGVMYNGFTGEEREASVKPQKQAKDAGNPPEPTKCSVTGFSDPEIPRGRGYIFTHLEDYRPQGHVASRQPERRRQAPGDLEASSRVIRRAGDRGCQIPHQADMVDDSRFRRPHMDRYSRRLIDIRLGHGVIEVAPCTFATRCKKKLGAKKQITVTESVTDGYRERNRESKTGPKIGPTVTESVTVMPKMAGSRLPRA